jgi:dTDP-3-amino-3,4,6-trideoxy-alpha-D-glucose transaminase
MALHANPDHTGPALRSLGGGASVPLLELDNSDPELLAELLEVVARVATSGGFTLGAEVEAFEREFAAWLGAPYTLGVSSGTEALVLALRALNIGAGDEVIVPSYTFQATGEAVVLAGATPRFVDVDPGTQLLTAEILERSIGPRTQAVIPVHLFGRTVEMDPLLAVARRAGIAVIEDTAQAHGATYKGRCAGTMGDAGCFSFYPTKNLGGWGDGGAVVTPHERVADRVQLLRSHGERPRYRHRIVGTTARLDGLQAAILRAKLPRMDGWNARRRAVADRYRAAMTGGAVTPPPAPPEHADHVYHLFVVQAAEREALRAHLTACGIATAVHYPVPLHCSEAFAGVPHEPGGLPVCERLTGQSLTLPMWPGIADAQVEAVIDAVAAFAAGDATAEPLAEAGSS